LRRLFVPVGLLALVAIGVHAAADALDERVLWLVDRGVAVLDSALSAWKVTEPLVNALGIEQRALIARSFALGWELAADLLIALPVLAYRGNGPGWRELLRGYRTRPTFAGLVRPFVTAALAVAGACATSRMVQGAVYLSLRQGLGEEPAGPLARLVAIAVLLLLCAAFGLPAVATAAGRPPPSGSRVPSLAAALVVLPMALAAVLDASPVLSFFR
jgi:hypothetical protein